MAGRLWHCYRGHRSAYTLQEARKDLKEKFIWDKSFSPYSTTVTTPVVFQSFQKQMFFPWVIRFIKFSCLLLNLLFIHFNVINATCPWPGVACWAITACDQCNDTMSSDWETFPHRHGIFKVCQIGLQCNILKPSQQLCQTKLHCFSKCLHYYANILKMICYKVRNL